ncbi:MAG: M48 family metallopeptidase [Chitinophagaceae bacterium]|jgi:predicted Zn-dependent protease|nr:M48 family metallopeptidase [Chitinophagaceae bacterium]
MKKLFAALIISAFAAGCSTNPVTGRSQFKLVPEQELQAMAAQEYQQFLSSSKVVSSSNNRDAEMVKRVGTRVTNAVKSYYASRNLSDALAGFTWEYNLVNDPAVNAWAMPGGRIVVYTGLLGVTKNEAALAAVIGHEISHAIFKHGNERMSQGLAQQLGGTALSIALANKPAQTQNLFNTAYGIGTNVGVLLPFSRKQESEADRYGLIWMAMAGYNPQEAIPLWERMEAASSGNKPPEFLSTHPSENTRMTNLRKWMPEALKYYKPMK